MATNKNAIAVTKLIKAVFLKSIPKTFMFGNSSENKLFLFFLKLEDVITNVKIEFAKC